MVRVKYRYFVLKINWKDGKIKNESPEYIKKAISERIKELYGTFGLALMPLKVKMYNRMTRMCIIRTFRSVHKSVWIAISMVRFIDDRNVSLNCIHLGGTIRKCSKAAEMYLRKMV
ncbi:hypothetical protein MHBO_001087 [Bonamia ostreae]|uniref:Uncharacterized protein n=1 Tax=Bonamia ostreae TaxID=126728 RepID=A0ABV2AHZ2_9EUKA